MFVGQFKDGMENGKGIYYEPNGNWLEGEYENGQPHGRVIMHYGNGEVEEQIYENGLRID